MSVVVVVKKDGEAVIAADTLFSAGSCAIPNPYTPGRSKLVALPDGFAGLVGTATNPLVLASIVRRKPESLDFSSVSAIFESLRGLQSTLIEDYFVRTEEDDPTQEYDSNQLDMLICNAHGIFGTLSYREVVEYDRFWAQGNGRDVALGAMHAMYEQASAEKIARAGVEAACEFDRSCRLPIHLHRVVIKG